MLALSHVLNHECRVDKFVYIPYQVSEMFQRLLVCRVECKLGHWLNKKSILEVTLSKHQTPVDMRVLTDDTLCEELCRHSFRCVKRVNVPRGNGFVCRRSSEVSVEHIEHRSAYLLSVRQNNLVITTTMYLP